MPLPMFDCRFTPESAAMHRYILHENIRRFEQQLAQASDKAEAEYVRALLTTAMSELASLEKLWRISCPNLNIRDRQGVEAEILLDRAVIASHADFGSLYIWNSSKDAFSLLAQTNFDGSFSERFLNVARVRIAPSRLLPHDIPINYGSPDFRDLVASFGISLTFVRRITSDDKKVLGFYSLHFRKATTLAAKLSAAYDDLFSIALQEVGVGGVDLCMPFEFQIIHAQHIQPSSGPVP